MIARLNDISFDIFDLPQDLAQLLDNDREHPARTVCAAGVISGVASWNDEDSAPPPSTALAVTLDADAEDGVKRWSGDAVKWNRR